MLFCHIYFPPSITPHPPATPPPLILPTSWITPYSNLLRWNSLKYALLSKYVDIQVTQVLCRWVKDLRHLKEEERERWGLGPLVWCLWWSSDSSFFPCPPLISPLKPWFVIVLWCREFRGTQRSWGAQSEQSTELAGAERFKFCWFCWCWDTKVTPEPFCLDPASGQCFSPFEPPPIPLISQPALSSPRVHTQLWAKALESTRPWHQV